MTCMIQSAIKGDHYELIRDLMARSAWCRSNTYSFNVVNILNRMARLGHTASFTSIYNMHITSSPISLDCIVAGGNRDILMLVRDHKLICRDISELVRSGWHIYLPEGDLRNLCRLQIGEDVVIKDLTIFKDVYVDIPLDVNLNNLQSIFIWKVLVMGLDGTPDRLTLLRSWDYKYRISINDMKKLLIGEKGGPTHHSQPDIVTYRKTEASRLQFIAYITSFEDNRISQANKILLLLHCAQITTDELHGYLKGIRPIQATRLFERYVNIRTFDDRYKIDNLVIISQYCTDITLNTLRHIKSLEVLGYVSSVITNYEEISKTMSELLTLKILAYNGFIDGWRGLSHSKRNMRCISRCSSWWAQ